MRRGETSRQSFEEMERVGESQMGGLEEEIVKEGVELNGENSNLVEGNEGRLDPCVTLHDVQAIVLES